MVKINRRDVIKSPFPGWMKKKNNEEPNTRLLKPKKIADHFPLETIPPAHLVILIPGALTYGVWADGYVEAGMKGIAFKPVKHFRTPAPSDLDKGDASEFSKHIATVSNALINAYSGARVSFVAHSFGTHVLCDLIEKGLIKANEKLFSIVLMGSIVDRRKVTVLRNACELLINECGTRDLLVAVVEAAWPAYYSATGHFGFGNHLCYDRFFNYGHSGATYKVHFDNYLRDIFISDGLLRLPIKRGTMSKPWLPAMTPSLLRELGHLKNFLFKP